MVCSNCNKEIEENWKFCPYCGHNLNNNNIFIFFIILYTIFFIIFYFSKCTAFLWADLITIITGKIKCPNNTVIKIIFYITISIFAVYMGLWMFMFETFGLVIK